MSLFAWLRHWGSGSSGAGSAGAIDVVVIKHPDGSLSCSPFHVSFGVAAAKRHRRAQRGNNVTKDGEEASHRELVSLTVNGKKKTEVFMRCGAAGEAFFVERVASHRVRPGRSRSATAEGAALLGISASHDGRIREEQKQEDNFLSAVDIPSSSISPPVPFPSSKPPIEVDTSLPTTPTAVDVSSEVATWNRNNVSRKSDASWVWRWGYLPTKARDVSSTIARGLVSPVHSGSGEAVDGDCTIGLQNETATSPVGEEVDPWNNQEDTQLDVNLRLRSLDSEHVNVSPQELPSDYQFTALTLCAHLLTQPIRSINYPHTTEALLELLFSYRVTREDLQHLSLTFGGSVTIPQGNETNECASGQLLDHSDLVVIVDDVLLNARVARELFALQGLDLTSVASGGMHGVVVTDDMVQLAVNRQYHLTELVSDDTPREQPPIWLGRRISEWTETLSALLREESLVEEEVKVDSEASEQLKEEKPADLVKTDEAFTSWKNSLSTWRDAFVDLAQAYHHQLRSKTENNDSHVVDGVDETGNIQTNEVEQQTESSFTAVQDISETGGAPVTTQDSNFLIEEEEVAGEESCVLSLKDVSIDDILPGPAGGDFYESDTDSFLDGSTASRSDSFTSYPSRDDTANRARFRLYRFRKSLVPSQEQLVEMDLQTGLNEVVFSLEGCRSVKAQVFVWEESSKFVVVDLEGIVVSNERDESTWNPFSTKELAFSDPLVELLTRIHTQGYHILYISLELAASMGNSHLGKSSAEEIFEKITTSSGSKLPCGPIFRSPDVLIETYGASRTEVFKATVLRGLRGLFPSTSSPFHAGFVSQFKDVVAYDRNGFPNGRVFVVSGSRNELSIVNRSAPMSVEEIGRLIDQMFPNVQPKKKQHEEYSDFNFWRLPPPTLIDL